MTTFRRFTCDDLLSFTNVNLDHWTETYGFPFYMSYLNRWPEYATIAENASSGRPMGYSLHTHTHTRTRRNTMGSHTHTRTQLSARWRGRRSCGTDT